MVSNVITSVFHFSSFLYSKVSRRRSLNSLKIFISHSLFSPMAFGVCPHHSIETALLRLSMIQKSMLSITTHPECLPASPVPSPLCAPQRVLHLSFLLEQLCLVGLIHSFALTTTFKLMIPKSISSTLTSLNLRLVRITTYGFSFHIKLSH